MSSGPRVSALACFSLSFGLIANLLDVYVPDSGFSWVFGLPSGLLFAWMLLQFGKTGPSYRHGVWFTAGAWIFGLVSLLFLVGGAKVATDDPGGNGHVLFALGHVLTALAWTCVLARGATKWVLLMVAGGLQFAIVHAVLLARWLQSNPAKWDAIPYSLEVTGFALKAGWILVAYVVWRSSVELAPAVPPGVDPLESAPESDSV